MDTKDIITACGANPLPGIAPGVYTARWGQRLPGGEWENVERTFHVGANGEIVSDPIDLSQDDPGVIEVVDVQLLPRRPVDSEGGE